MKILSVFLATFISTNLQAKTFYVVNAEVKQGDTLVVRIDPSFQGPLVCLSAFERQYRPNKYGYVFMGISADTKPTQDMPDKAKYLLYLVECGRGVRLDWNYEEFSVLKKSFPEIRIRANMTVVDSRRRAKEGEAISKAYAKGSSWEWHPDGGFVNPLGVVEITDAFGVKRSYLNGESRHGGVDLRASVGTQVRAVNSGVVVLTARGFSLEGNMVIVDHGSGVFSLYLHLSKINVKENQKVKKSQEIGLSGSSGAVTGPHLHFMVKANGANVDPLSFIGTFSQYLK